MTDEERVLLGNRIKRAREYRDMTLLDVAKAVQVEKSTIQRYEAAKIKSPKIPVIDSIAASLKVNPLWLLGKSEQMEETNHTHFNNVFPVVTKSFPLFDGIACGEPILMPDGIELYVEATVDVHVDYVLRCHGDSMTGARIQDGDLVFIRTQSMVENGEIAAVAIDDEATLKRFYRDEETGTVTLVAENPKYPPIVLNEKSGKNVRILGKAVAFQSDVK